jgi:hypothetical protein
MAGDSNVADFQYKIGATEEELVSLHLLKIPWPDQVIYSAASVYYPRSDMSRVGDGYASVSWIWDVISRTALATLLQYVGGSSAVVYIQTDVRDGTIAKPSAAFSKFRCTMWMPILSGEEGTPIARSALGIQTVQIKFVNLVEI